MTSKVDNINQKIGLKIRLERAKRNWSQEKLAEISDMSKTFIGDIERGKSSPTIETLVKIASAFEIELHDLTNVSKVDI